MLAPEEIRELAERKYLAFLESIVTGTEFFPLPVRFGKPKAGQNFQLLRDSIARLAEPGHGYRIDWTEHKFRSWGQQRIPERVWFENEAEFLETIGKTSEVRRFRQNIDLTRQELPELEPWLASHVRLVREHASKWLNLLQVCRYFLNNPCPGCYAREIPLPVDTKFIENNEGILERLLTAVLPPEAIREGTRFEKRFGLQFDEPTIRFRLLDQDLSNCLNCILQDVSTRISEFQRLSWAGLNVVISENKMTFLTLPPLPNAIGIFGGGYAVQLLTEVEWLRNCKVYYWSDLDAQGYTMLARLRDALPQTRSVLMDVATLDAFLGIAGKGTPGDTIADGLLHADEAAAWERVKDGKTRIEQERIPNAEVAEYLRGMIR